MADRARRMSCSIECDLLFAANQLPGTAFAAGVSRVGNGYRYFWSWKKAGVWTCNFGILKLGLRLRSGPGTNCSGLATADVQERMMNDLTAGVHLSPGELRVEFFGTEDLPRHLYELSQAIVNDFGRFQKVVGHPAFNR